MDCILALFSKSWAPFLALALLCPSVSTAEEASRSTKILKNPTFFEAEFAQGLIESHKEILSSKNRRSFKTTGKFSKKPSLDEIIQTYGQPDLVTATKEFYLNGDKAKSYTVTAFYDRVGFSVYGKNKKSQLVQIVTLQAHDYSKSLRPETGKFLYEIASNRNRIFFVDGEEVGLQIYTGRREWTTVGAIPPGEYKTVGHKNPYAKISIDNAGSGSLNYFYSDGSKHEEINFRDGKYHGEYVEMDEDGWAVQNATYEDSRLNGPLIRYHERGVKKAEATYSHGKIHGAAQEYYPNGKVRSKIEYSHGKPMTALQQFDESGKQVAAEGVYSGHD